MASRLAVLIAALLAFAVPLAHAAANGRTPAAGCLACHARHFETLGDCTGCHRGDARAKRTTVAHDRMLRGAQAAWSIPNVGAVRDGEWLRDRLGCRRCHVTGGRGNALATSLDAVAWQRDPEALKQSLLHPVTFMPDFGLAPWQADRLIALLLRDGDRAARMAPTRVLFRAGRAPARDAFERRCGGCHRALTPAGALGVGTSGPNLSGLLGGFYPAADGLRWDRDRLARWIRNPRVEKPGATMPPIPDLAPAELDEIGRLLAPPATGSTPERR